jgi:hypothetical protein
MFTLIFFFYFITNTSMIELLQSISYKEILVFIAIAMWIYSYIPYFRDMFAGKTKPHIFSWFIWTLLTAIAFFWQLSDGAGLWARVTLLFCVCSWSVVLYAYAHHGNKQVHASDRWSFWGALFALLLRYLTNNVLRSMILVTLIDALWFFPTFRKGRQEPYSETISTYMLNWIKFFFAIAAFDNFSRITVLYPASLILMNCLFAFMVMYRRKQILPI